MTTGARSSARSGKKRAGKAVLPYPPERRAEAETLMREEGMAAAHDVTGIPKSTLSRWAAASGIDLAGPARERTAVATEAVRERAARARLNTVELLEDHIGEAGSYLTTVVKASAAAAELLVALDPDLVAVTQTDTGPIVTVSDEVARDAIKLATALSTIPLAVRDAEGIVTRAIHDLQLLRGEATERGELVVEFGGIPRPRPADVKVDQHDAPDEN